MDLRWLLTSMRSSIQGMAFPGLIDEEDTWWEKDPFHILSGCFRFFRLRIGAVRVRNRAGDL